MLPTPRIGPGAFCYAFIDEMNRHGHELYSFDDDTFQIWSSTLDVGLFVYLRFDAAEGVYEVDVEYGPRAYMW